MLAALVLLAWCGWVSGFHRFTTPARITWVISLAAVVAVDLAWWQGRHGRRPGWRLEPVSAPWPREGRGGTRRALLGVAPWVLVALVVLAWELLGLFTGAHTPHLTISALSQAFRPLHAALLVTWMLVGMGYGAARARAPLIPRRGPLGGGGTTTAASGGALALVHRPLLGVHPALVPALLLGRSRAAGVAFWLAVMAVCVVMDQVARRTQGAMANAEEFVRFISTAKVPQALVVVAWAYAGWHLFAH